MTKPPSPRSLATKRQVVDALQGDPTVEDLTAALEILAKWRAKLVQNTLRAEAGNTVAKGPFTGMIYPAFDTADTDVPRLLGCYEAGLIPILEDIIAAAPPLIMDVGCGSGFYAVGFSVALPRSTIWARDADPTAQENCRTLAGHNDVAHRVKVGGKLTHADFDICRAQPTTLICNIGAAAEGLLDPLRAKGLVRADLLVTVDELSSPGLTQTLIDRFTPTHHVTAIPRQFSSADLPSWTQALSDLDRLVALCEWQNGQTVWLWFQRKAH